MSSSDEPAQSSHQTLSERESGGASDQHRGGSVTRGVMLAVVLTGLLMFVEVVGGFISGSLSLLADACYMLADLIALSVAWFSLKHIPDDNPRWNEETCARLTNRVGLVIGALLCVLGLAVGIDAIRRLATGDILIMPKLMFWTAIAGLVVNLICWRILTLSGKGTADENVLEASRHTLNDTLGSIAVAAAALAIVFGAAWFVRVDAILAICFAVLMLLNGGLAIKENRRELAGTDSIPAGDTSNS